MVAGLGYDGVDHDLTAIRAGYLLLYGVYKLLGLVDLLLLLLDWPPHKAQPEAYGLLLIDFTNRQQPKLISLDHLNPIILANPLSVEVGAIGAQISQLNLLPFLLKQTVL